MFIEVGDMGRQVGLSQVQEQHGGCPEGVPANRGILLILVILLIFVILLILVILLNFEPSYLALTALGFE